MSAPRVMVVVAHPDDETFGCGGLILHAKEAGAHVSVVCATRGEAGASHVAHDDLGRVREDELRAAAVAMGVDEVAVLGLGDSDMSGPTPPETLVGAPFEEVVEAVVARLEDGRPDVVVTLDASDGHRDHARIRDVTLAAAERCGVERVYLSCLPRSLMQQWMDQVAGISPDKAHLRVETELGTPDEQITTLVDVRHHAEAWDDAMAEHATQASPYDGLPTGLRRAFLDTARARRLHPAWQSGDPRESTLLP